MSDYRDANDPLQRNTPIDLNARDRGGAWAWIAGAVLVAILVAFAVGIKHTNTASSPGSNVASNNTPMMSRPAPTPSGPASPSFTPAPTDPSNPAPLSPPAQK